MSIQQRSIETRQNIIKAGKACFAQGGYDATSVSAICEGAGISKGAFYHHFSSKQELYLGILEEWLADLNRMVPNFIESGSTIPESFRQMSELVPMVFQLADGQLPVMFDFWARAARDPELFEKTITPLKEFETLFASYIQRGKIEGSIKEVDAEVTSKVLISLVLGVLLQGLLAPDDTEWGHIAKQGVSWIFDALEAKK